jgi:hypothetical protein
VGVYGIDEVLELGGGDLSFSDIDLEFKIGAYSTFELYGECCVEPVHQRFVLFTAEGGGELKGRWRSRLRLRLTGIYPRYSNLSLFARLPWVDPTL